MSSAVLDASVLLAHISGERRSDPVPYIAADALMSAVNLAEVFSKLVARPLYAGEDGWQAGD